MSQPRRSVERLLSVDEHAIVVQTHHPDLSHLTDEDLLILATRLRDARNRARTIAQRQRREIRGKAAPSGSRAATDNTGSIGKSGVLAAALKRVNKEGARRRAMRAKAELVGNARRALATKRAVGDAMASWPRSRTAGEGMQLKSNPGNVPSGALEQEGYRPVLERSRKVR